MALVKLRGTWNEIGTSKYWGKYSKGKKGADWSGKKVKKDEREKPERIVYLYKIVYEQTWLIIKEAHIFFQGYTSASLA